MKMQLKKQLVEPVKIISLYEIEDLCLEGEELKEKLRYYLSKFTEGILDPDVANKSPDKFILNLEKGLLGDFSKRYITVAKNCRKEVIGILIGLPQNNEILHIFSLHVDPEYRNQGVASTLLKRCINDMFLREMKALVLDVHIDNKPAYSLYKKFDFKNEDEKVKNK